jgi:GntR family transcriptional regulator, negative regulator for fad regulon and positive regulator of fabA
MAVIKVNKPQRPIDQAQRNLITAILRGDFPPGASLPGERTLAKQLGVTRPTLREALRRMETDGWLSIQHGKSTVVNDYQHDGGLNVLYDIVRYSDAIPADFVLNLLQVRCDLAPSYTRTALANDPATVITLLQAHTHLDDTPTAYAQYDWTLHHTLTVASGNPVYTMILNGFKDFYAALAASTYFQLALARQKSADFYARLLEQATQGNLDQAETLTRRVMELSITLWDQASKQDP